MAKAERLVLPGRTRNESLPGCLNEAAAALVALLNGAEQIPTVGQCCGRLCGAHAAPGSFPPRGGRRHG